MIMLNLPPEFMDAFVIAYRLILNFQGQLSSQPNLTLKYPSLLALQMLKFSFHPQHIHWTVSYWVTLPFLHLCLLEELVRVMIQFIDQMMSLNRFNV